MIRMDAPASVWTQDGSEHMERVAQRFVEIIECCAIAVLITGTAAAAAVRAIPLIEAEPGDFPAEVARWGQKLGSADLIRFQRATERYRTGEIAWYEAEIELGRLGYSRQDTREIMDMCERH